MRISDWSSDVCSSDLAWGIDDLLAEHKGDLEKLRGQVDILAGGPPCQGFSFAGRRVEDDPRNQLFNKYVEVVAAIQPSALILENVPSCSTSDSLARFRPMTSTLAQIGRAHV